MKLHLSLFAGVSLAWLAGCGGATTSDSTALADDAGTDAGTTADTGTGPDAEPQADAGADAAPDVDNGAPSTTYPAFKPDMPQLQNNGGAVLTNPVVVTVTWPNEPNAAAYESFADALAGSDYWKTIVGEYGVGDVVSGTANHIRETTALPAQMSDSDLDTFVATAAGDPMKAGWPAPTAQTIYTLYLPTTTKLMLQGMEACSSGIGGYHSSTNVKGMEVAYAIIPQCNFGGISIVDESTSSASHEIAEAATDPHPQTQTDVGWIGVDDAHLAWDVFMQFQLEDGDLCEVYEDAFFKPKSGPLTSFAIQRMWSNASATAGHNPCVPVPSTPYFNVVPLGQDTLTADLSAFGGSAATKVHGYKIALNETRSFMVGLYSDGAVGPWNLSVQEGNAFGSGGGGGGQTQHRLDLSVDLTTGQNGQKAQITVTPRSAGRLGVETFLVVSELGGVHHYMPISIGQK